jgi:hypothetical protein
VVQVTPTFRNKPCSYINITGNAIQDITVVVITLC